MKFIRLTCLLLPLVMTACSEKFSLEEQIRQRIQQGELAVEAGKKIEFAGLISENYKDQNNRTAKDVRRMAIGLMLRYKPIHLLARIQSVTMLSETEGTAVVLMGMLSQQQADQLPLPLIRADLYRFDLTFRLEAGEWNLIKGDWRPALPEDLLE